MSLKLTDTAVASAGGNLSNKFDVSVVDESDPICGSEKIGASLGHGATVSFYETGPFKESHVRFGESETFPASPNLGPSPWFTASKTFLVSADFLASDLFESSPTLGPDEAGAKLGSLLGVGQTGLIGIGAGVLALILMAALVIWRLKRNHDVASMCMDGEANEVASEFTWEAQVDDAFNEAAQPTLRNPIGSSLWDPSHFSQILMSQDHYDPFTQFE
jgi:hypothetical protein